MAFAQPLALLLLPSLAVLVWLYLRQPRGRAFVVPSLLLWSQVQADTLHARRWRPDVSFLLRLLSLLALVFGLAAPTRNTTASADRRRIVVLDVSASMQATTDGSSRFERAIAALDEGLQPGPHESVVLLSSARRAERVLPPTRDMSRLRATLAELRPSDLAGGPAAGIALARQLAAASSVPATIEVFTDRAGATQVAAQVADAAVTIFGEERRNVGIVGLQVQQGRFEAASAATAAVEVRNFGADREHRSLTVELNGRPVAREGFSLEPGAVRRVDVSGFTGAGALVARLEPMDALTLDDHASAWVAEPRRARLLLAGWPAALVPQLERLAAALGLPVESATAATQESATDVWLGYGAVQAVAATANQLWVAPDAPLAGVAVGDWVENVAVVDWNDRHAALAGITPSFSAPLTRVRELQPGNGAEVLLWGEAAGRNVPLVVAVESPRPSSDGAPQRQVLLALDLAASGVLSNDDPGLALLMTGLLAWLLPEGGETLSAAVGSVVAVDPATTHVVLPSGATAPVDGALHGFELPRVGLYRFVQASGERVVAAQLADASESDLAGQEAVAAAPIPSAAAAPLRLVGDSRWARWAYVVALGLWCIDWLWALRRREGME